MNAILRVCAWLSVVPVLGGSAAPARGDVIFNNFGFRDSYDPAQGFLVGTSIFGGPPVQEAMAFTPVGASYFTFDRLEIALGLSRGPNLIEVSLTTSVDGTPGLTLETFRFVNAMGPFGLLNPPLVADSVLHPLLSEGTQYWIVASAPDPGTSAEWNLTFPADIGIRGFRQGDDPWQVFHNNIRSAFRVSGEPVPEPGTLVLLSLGILGLLGHRKICRALRFKSA